MAAKGHGLPSINQSVKVTHWRGSCLAKDFGAYVSRGLLRSILKGCSVFDETNCDIFYFFVSEVEFSCGYAGFEDLTMCFKQVVYKRAAPSLFTSLE